MPSRTICDRGPNCGEQYKYCIDDALSQQETWGHICTSIDVGCAIWCFLNCRGQRWCKSKCAVLCTFAGGGCEILNLTTFVGNLKSCEIKLKNCQSGK